MHALRVEAPGGSAARCRRRASALHCRRCELQRAQLVAARALDRLELAGHRSLRRSCAPPSAGSAAAPCGRVMRVRAAADQRDALAVLVGDHACRRRRCGRRCEISTRVAVSTSPRCAGARKSTVEARGDGELVARVAGEREGRVGERRDEAAVADVVAVEHVVAHRHRQRRRALADVERCACRGRATRGRSANMCSRDRGRIAGDATATQLMRLSDR